MDVYWYVSHLYFRYDYSSTAGSKPPTATTIRCATVVASSLNSICKLTSHSATSKLKINSLPPLLFMTAADFRTFLKARAIPYYGYCKAEVDCMVEKAIGNPDTTEIIIVSRSICHNLVGCKLNIPSSPNSETPAYLLSKGGLSPEWAISYGKKGVSSWSIVALQPSRLHALLLSSHIFLLWDSVLALGTLASPLS